MSLPLVLALAAAIVATSFLSGLFGMAGGLVLVGILLALLPVPAAMALHSIAQIACNVGRAVLWRRHIRLRVAAAYATGCIAALGFWSLWRFVPSPAIAILFLGLLPFVARLVPERLRPVPEKCADGVVLGAICMTLMLLTGAAGPILDRFFLNGRLDRREIVATKGACQVFGHGAKLLYFGGIVENSAALDPWVAALAVAAAVLGTALSKRFLEAMDDAVFRRWAGAIVTAISGWYVAQGAWLLVAA
jgi:uncharacterized membrane protein YfcA